MALCKQQTVVPCVLDHTATRFHQPPPEVAKLVGNQTQLQHTSLERKRW